MKKRVRHLKTPSHVKRKRVVFISLFIAVALLLKTSGHIGPPHGTVLSETTLPPVPTMNPNYGHMYYVNCQNGNDNNTGLSQLFPVKTLGKVITMAVSGDTIIIDDGICTIPNGFRFGPAGSPAKQTVFKADDGARPIITTSTNLPPTVYMADYVTLDSLWMGGTWDRNISTSIFAGGSPIGNGKQFLNNTFWGYEGGLSSGSNQNLLVRGNRFVHTGNGYYAHPIYVSGGYTPGAMTNRVIVDDNIFINGDGWGIHFWHEPRTGVISRNFVARQRSGLANNGDDMIIANNVLWKLNDGTGISVWFGPNTDPGEYNLGGYRIQFLNNVIKDGQLFNQDLIRPDNVINHNAFINASNYGYGSSYIHLPQNSETRLFGISEGGIDNALDALDASFYGSPQDIHDDVTIEANFTKLRLTTKSGTELYDSGSKWWSGITKKNIGMDIEAPDTLSDWWGVLAADGLIVADSSGHQITGPTVPQCYYQQVQCIRAPCNPILVCPTPTPTQSLFQSIIDHFLP